MINLQPYAKIGCVDPADICSGGGCGVEFNPWIPYLIQANAEANALARIPGLPSADLTDCLCSDIEPAEPKTLPSEPVTGGFFGWWFHAAEAVIADEASGFVFHSFTLQDPMELNVTQTERLRSRGCLIPGLLIGEMKLEIVASTERASKWLAGITKHRLEAASSCAGSTMDVFVDCCTGSTGADVLSGLRRLTDVSEFNVVEVDEPTFSPASTMITVTFSAAALVEHPAALIAAGAAALLGTAALPACPPTTQTVNRTTYTPKTTKLADVELQTDGTLRLCPVDYTAAFNPVTDYLKIRNPRQAAGVTNPCPTEVDLNLTGAAPVITAYQPSLYQTQVLDRIAATTNLDCSNPIKVRTLTVANPDFTPACPDCPSEILAAECAKKFGLIVKSDGFIDIPATYASLDGGVWPGFIDVEWDWTGTPPTLPKTIDAMINYVRCVGGVFTPWSNQGCAIGTPDVTAYTHEQIRLETHGGLTTEAHDAAHGTVQGPCSDNVWDIVGMSYSGIPGSPPNLSLPAIIATPIPGVGSCGPGEAQSLGTVDGAFLSTNADLTMVGGIVSQGGGLFDVATWTLPGLVKTTVNAGFLQPMGTAIHHGTNEIWSTEIVGTDIQLWEGAVLAGVASFAAWGREAVPVYDHVTNRMLVLFAGEKRFVPVGVREDLVVAEWAAGAVLTELHSTPIDTFALPGITHFPGIGVQCTLAPSGGFFFYLGNDWSVAPPVQSVDTLNHWHPVNGFAHKVAGITNYYSGMNLTVTPTGDYVWWDEDQNPVVPVFVNEANLTATPTPYTGCSPAPAGGEFGAEGMPAPGFEIGLASLDSGTSALYLIDHRVQDLDPCGTIGAYCFPTVTIAPIETGPCVTITIAADGTATMPIDPTVDELSRARFEFGPCSPTSEPGCPGVIPTVAPFHVDTGTGTLVTDGTWTIGYQWPLDTTGDRYPILLVDGVANSADPATASTPVEQPLPDNACPAPCGDIAAVIPDIIPAACWIDSTDPMDVFVASAAGLSPSRKYRPVWSVKAPVGTAVVQPQVFLWSGPSTQAPPTMPTLATFLCGTHSTTKIKALAADQTVTYNAAGLRVSCATGTLDALSGGWVDATQFWSEPAICGDETAYLIVAAPPGEVAAADVTLDLVPVSTP